MIGKYNHTDFEKSAKSFGEKKSTSRRNDGSNDKLLSRSVNVVNRTHDTTKHNTGAIETTVCYGGTQDARTTLNIIAVK